MTATEYVQKHMSHLSPEEQAEAIKGIEEHFQQQDPDHAALKEIEKQQQAREMQDVVDSITPWLPKTQTSNEGKQRTKLDDIIDALM